MVDGSESERTAVVDLDIEPVDILITSPGVFAAVPVGLVSALMLVALARSVFQEAAFLSELKAIVAGWWLPLLVVALVGTPLVAWASAWWYSRKLSGQVPGSRIRVSREGIAFLGGGMAIEHGWGHIDEIQDRDRFFVVECLRGIPHIVPKRSILDHPDAQWILDTFEEADGRSSHPPDAGRDVESGVSAPLESNLRDLLFGGFWKFRYVFLVFGGGFLLLPVFLLAFLHLGSLQAENVKPPLSLWAEPVFWGLFGLILIPMAALVLVWLIYGYLSTRRWVGGSEASVLVDENGWTWRTADGWTRDSWSFFGSVSRAGNRLFLDTNLGYVVIDRNDVDPEDWPVLEELLDEKLAD